MMIFENSGRSGQNYSHLLFRPDKQLVSTDVTMIPSLYRRRPLIQIFRMNAYSMRKLPQVNQHILITSPGDDTAWVSKSVSRCYP